MIGWILSAAAAFGGYELYKKEKAKKGTTNAVAPPGAKQPPGTVAIPKIGAVSDQLHAAAASAVQFLNTTSPNTSSNAPISAFQNAYNVANPSAPLQADGKYGAKSQAALQAVIAPATAPGNWFPGGGVAVPGPAVPAAPATQNVSVVDAANAIVSMGTVPKASVSQVSTFQLAYNGTSPATHLVQDGKYGKLSKAAVQATLDANGGGTAPNAAY